MLIEFGCPWPTMMLNGTWTKAICRSGPDSAGSDFTKSALSERFCLPGGTGCGDSWMTPVSTWLWKFSPTPGRSTDGFDPDGLQLPLDRRSRRAAGARGFDRSGTDDDLGGRAGLVGPSVLEVLDTGAAAILDDEARGQCIRRERQVRPPERRFEIGLECGDALAGDDVDVMPARPNHVRAVEVVGGRVAQPSGQWRR